jgi:hypothetical protein
MTTTNLPATTPARRGVILILVVGIAVLILTVTLSMVALVRADTRSVEPVVQDVQARAMLDAALCYVAECSRIGWEPFDRRAAGGAAPSLWWTETAGWNDVRNGRIGPIPLRVSDGSTTWEDPQDHAGHAQLVRGALVQTNPAWPAMGSVLRVPMHALERPPFAVQEAMGNPVTWYDSRSDVPSTGGWLLDRSSGQHNAWLGVTGVNYTGALTSFNYSDLTQGPAYQGYRVSGSEYNRAGKLWRFAHLPNPDPAPPAGATQTSFAQGQPTPQPASERRSWFRVYRERPADHNGDQTPWYDTIDLNGGEAVGSEYANGSVFVFTCGAGGTLGFRDWAEVVASVGASDAAALFGTRTAFEDLRRMETILWFRAEWTPLTGGNLGPDGALTRGTYNGPTGQRTPMTLQRYFWTDHSGWRSWNDHGKELEHIVTAPYPAPFGSFLWLQALDREPATW